MSFDRDAQRRPGATAVSRHDVAIPGKRTLVEDLPPIPPLAHPVQRSTGDGGQAPTSPEVHAAAAHGTSGPSTQLPHLDRIQRAFGRFDVSHVQAHVGGRATEGAEAMGADAFATGNRVAFAGSPDLHTAAHEAAHVVQQRAGVQLKGGVGEAGDPHEQHADAVADRVVAGGSAEELLEDYAGGEDGETVAEDGGEGGDHPVQRHVFINGQQVKVGPTRKILRRGWRPMTGVTRQMRHMAKDQLVRDYQSKAEFQRHAAGQTDYLGNLNDGTWVRFSPNGTNVLGENHTHVTLEQVVQVVGSTSFIYEPFSSDNLPDGHMKTAYETENNARFNNMGVGGVANKQQFGGESLFPKMGYGLDLALPYFDGTQPLDGLKQAGYVGQPVQRYLKIAWGHSRDNHDQVQQNQQSNQQVTAARLALSNVHAQVTGQLDAFITALPIDGFLGDALDDPQHHALVGPNSPLDQFAQAFVDAMVELAAETPSSRLDQQTRQNILGGQGPGMPRTTLFADWRNNTFEDALHDAVGRGVRYAGMGALHLQHLQNVGMPNNTHAFDMQAGGQELDDFIDHTQALAGIAVQQ